MKTYENSINKREVKADILSGISPDFHSNALLLLGPNWDLALEEIKNISSEPYHIFSYEIDRNIYLEQLINLRNRENIHINLGSVINAIPRRYIDLDLTATILTQGDIIKELFNKQSLAYPTKDKIFTFTLSTRLAGGRGVTSKGLTVINTVFPFLEKMVNIEISDITHSRNQRGNWEYFFTTNSTKYSIRVLSYRDGGAMLTVLIQYK